MSLYFTNLNTYGAYNAYNAVHALIFVKMNYYYIILKINHLFRLSRVQNS